MKNKYCVHCGKKLIQRIYKTPDWWESDGTPHYKYDTKTGKVQYSKELVCINPICFQGKQDLCPILIEKGVHQDENIFSYLKRSFSTGNFSHKCIGCSRLRGDL